MSEPRESNLPRPPAHVASYVEILGTDIAIEFLLAFGGAELYHADDPKGGSRLAKVIGLQNARKLAGASAAFKTRVPIPRAWIAQTLAAKGLSSVVTMGMRVRESDLREKFGFSEPEEGDRILGVSAQNPPQRDPNDPNADDNTRESEFKYRSNTHLDPKGASAALNASTALSGPENAPSPDRLLAEQLDDEAAPLIQGMLEQLETMMSKAGSLEELREMWLAAYPQLDVGAFGEVLADAMMAAEAGGRAEAGAGRGCQARRYHYSSSICTGTRTVGD